MNKLFLSLALLAVPASVFSMDTAKNTGTAVLGWLSQQAQDNWQQFAAGAATGALVELSGAQAAVKGRSVLKLVLSEPALTLGGTQATQVARTRSVEPATVVDAAAFFAGQLTASVVINGLRDITQ